MERQNSPSSCSPLTTLTTYSSSGERRSEATRLLPHVAFSSPRGDAWSALGISLGAFSSLGCQEGFLEEGASQLRLEGRVGANLVEREELASSREKGVCQARDCEEQD